MPPDRATGSVAPVTLAAAGIAGVDEVFAVWVAAGADPVKAPEPVFWGFDDSDPLLQPAECDR